MISRLGRMDRNLNSKIKVLVVDDSALMSRQIAGILNDDHRIEVVGRARDGLEALDMVGAAQLKRVPAGRFAGVRSTS